MTQKEANEAMAATERLNHPVYVCITCSWYLISRGSKFRTSQTVVKFPPKVHQPEGDRPPIN